MTAASRKSAERQRRKDAGEVRVEFWVSATTVSDLESLRYWPNETLTKNEALEYAVRIAINES